MPTLLDSPDVAANPFADLIQDPAPEAAAATNELIGGGTADAPAFQRVNGTVSDVPRAVAVSTTDYGPFSDLVKASGPAPVDNYEQEFGMFADIVPRSPTPETDKAVDETPFNPRGEEIGPTPAGVDSGFVKAQRPDFAPQLAEWIDRFANAVTGGRSGEHTVRNLLSDSTRPDRPGEPNPLTNAGIPTVPPQQGTAAQIGAGLANIPIGLANFLLAPGGLSLVNGLEMAPKLAQTLVGAGFTAQQADEFLNAKTMQEKITSGVGAALLGLGTAHGVKTETPTSPEKASEAAPATPSPEVALAQAEAGPAASSPPIQAAPVEAAPDTTAGAPAATAEGQTVPQTGSPPADATAPPIISQPATEGGDTNPTPEPPNAFADLVPAKEDGPLGPVYDQFAGKPSEATDHLLSVRKGEAPGALYHEATGPIDLVWGEPGTGASDGYGLSKIEKFHPEVLHDLQGQLDQMAVSKVTPNRITLESPSHEASVRLDWDGEKKTWLLTEYQKREGDNPTGRSTDLPGAHGEASSPAPQIASPSDPATTEKSVQPNSPTGIRNAIVDQQREARGLPARMAPLRRALGTAFDEATKQLDADPAAGAKLVNDLKKGSRPLTDTEDALLAHETVTRENSFDNAVDAVNNAPDEASRAKAKIDLAVSRDAVQELYDAGQAAGTATARGLNARKLLVNQDYSLARMEATKRAVANDGAQLSETQLADVKAAHDEIARLKAKVDAYEKAGNDRAANDVFSQLVKELSKDARQKAKAGVNLRDNLNAAAVKAKQRIIARRGRLNVGIDPTALVDEAIIGASHIANGLSTLADWSGAMVKDFGERIKPYLSDLFERAKALHAAHAKLYEAAGKGTEKTLESIKADALAKAAAGGALDHQTVYDLARAHVNAGVEGLDNVMRAVHGDLQEAHPGLSEREVRDAFSEYGKTKFPSKAEDLSKLREYRRLAQLVSAIEDANAKEAPRKTGMQRDKPSQAVREKMKELQEAMRANGIETTSPEEQIASTNQARETSLRNQIEDIEKELRTGEKPVKKGPPVPETPAVQVLKVKRDALKAQLQAIRDAANPPKTPQEIALERYKKAIVKRTADINDRLARNDYTRPVRNKTQLDAEALRLQAEHQRAKDKFDTGLEKERLAKRRPYEKVLDTFSRWRRAFLLSGPITLAKLSSAAVERMAFTPIEEGIGAVISKLPVLSRVAELAPREGGGSIRAEARALTEGFTEGAKDAWQVLRTGRSDLDVKYGKRQLVPRSAIEFIGSIHGALKTVTKRNEFARSFQLRTEAAIRAGLDPTEPMLQTRIGLEAYKDASRSIFLQDNRVVSAYKAAVSALERPDKATGKPTAGGKVGATVARVVLPIVKVPANIVAETFQYALGSVTGSVRLVNALRRGIDTLKPEEADLILRDLKKGSLGAAVLAIGYFNAESIGGYYQPGEKRADGDVKAGRLRVLGVDVPTYLVHNPLLEVLQIGAAVRRVADSRLRKSDAETQGLGAGIAAAALGLTEEVPFVKETLGGAKLYDPHQRGKFLGDYAKSLVVPQGVQWLAAFQDSDPAGNPVKRYPGSIMENIETGIPVLRQTVPEQPPERASTSNRRSAVHHRR